MDNNAHEFTLAALVDLHDTAVKLNRKINKMKFSHNIIFAGLVIVGYYMYDSLKQDIYELRKENKELKTKIQLKEETVNL